MAQEGPVARELFESVYADLRRLADRILSRERADHTLQPTALVHESWLKLADQERARFEDQAHFLAMAATAMRNILVDHARGRGAQKRGGAWGRVTLDARLADVTREVDVLALEDGLEKLEGLDPRQAKVVELRFFGGLSEEEVARVLGISRSTVTREWRMARAFLAKGLET